MNNLTDIEFAVLVKSKPFIKKLYEKYDEAYLKDKFPHIFEAMGDTVMPVKGYTKGIRSRKDISLYENYLKYPSKNKLHLREVYKDWCIYESSYNVTCRKLERIDENISVLFVATATNNYYELLENNIKC